MAEPDPNWAQGCIEAARANHPVSDAVAKRLSNLLSTHFKVSQPSSILDSLATTLITDAAPPKAKPPPKAAS